LFTRIYNKDGQLHSMELVKPTQWRPTPFPWVPSQIAVSVPHN